MKVWYGITKSNFGGAQRYVFDLAREAQKAGHSVTVLCGGQGALVEKLRSTGIRVIPLPHMQREISIVEELRSLHFLFRTLYTEKPDVFHTNSSKMGGLGNLAARIAGIRKIVFTAHGWEFNAPRPWWSRLAIKFFAWLTVMLSHRTICVSEKTRSDVPRWPLLRSRLSVVHNGVEKFDILPREVARKELGLSEDDGLAVGTLAELHPVKGLDILLLAWADFITKHKAKLLILGEGEQRDELEELINILGIADSVELKGFVPEGRKYLHSFDIFVLPSRSEAMPYTILEAGFAGEPVIATNVGGIPEIIDTGINGVLVDPNEADSIFSTLMLLSQDKALRKRLGEELKEKVMKEFSLKQMAEETLKLY